MSKNIDSDQLNLLMQYTSSHMMVFIGVIAAVASGYKYIEETNKMTDPAFVFFIIAGVCFLFAGIAIGMIASYIPHFENYNKFVDGELKLFYISIKYEKLEIAQNYGFWLGVFCSIVAFCFSNFDSG